MIKIEKTEFTGFEAAIRGMRNPMNSWEKSDTIDGYGDNGADVIIGKNDLDLMRRLRNAGTEHRKYMRMMVVYCDITAPLYWWKEFDTYKVGTVANSCSTMHKIHAKEFTLDDFSHEYLLDCDVMDLPEEDLFLATEWEDEEEYWDSAEVLNTIIKALNHYRQRFIATKDKKYWQQMIQLLPTSYNQLRTVMLNYEVLANIYRSRKNHKLTEWHTFCDWIKSLPYSELITGEVAENVKGEA